MAREHPVRLVCARVRTCAAGVRTRAQGDWRCLIGGRRREIGLTGESRRADRSRWIFGRGSSRSVLLGS